MPLRKKHVRWTLAAILVLLVCAVALAMTLYGLHLRTGYARELKAELESRLRCAAEVTGLRPQGLSAAVADDITLTWTAAGGRLVLGLSNVKAESNAYGWYIRAGRGQLALEGPAPLETLAALNQRLVQPEAGGTHLVSLGVERLDVRLDAGGRTLRTELQAVALANMTAYTVTLCRPQAGKGPMRGPRDEVPPGRSLVCLRLNPASGRGLFESVKADIGGLPLGRPATDAGKPAADVITATLDLDADWSAAAPPAAGNQVRAVFHDLDLAAWTRGVPGGPVTGDAALTLACVRPAAGPDEVEVCLESDGGRLSPATLQWLGTLPAGLTSAAPAGDDPVEFSRAAVRCLIVDCRARFEGTTDSSGTLPLVTTRLMGMPVPLVQASVQPFDSREVWPMVAKALGLDGAQEGAAAGKP
ncbi:MAG: hypothetical protein IMZ44_00220 [Planctomycetes bacterium]|nr:hypothetical protein [Planctomycetota bacterium]